MSQVNALKEPIHERQDGESDREYQAFRVFLETSSHARTCAAVGISAEEERALAQRWAWTARSAARDSFESQVQAETLRRVSASFYGQRAAFYAEAQNLIRFEQAKYAALAMGLSPEHPPILSIREIASLSRSINQAAHTLDPEKMTIPDPEDAPDFSRLSPEELRAWQNMRTKVQG